MCSNAGTNFAIDELKRWYDDQGIELTVTWPKHQKQNGFVKAAYKNANKMAHSILVQAYLPLSFLHFTLDYACHILIVLPPKGLYKDDNLMTTTYELLHKKQPHIQYFEKSMVVQWCLNATSQMMAILHQVYSTKTR